VWSTIADHDHEYMVPDMVPSDHTLPVKFSLSGEYKWQTRGITPRVPG